MHESDLAPCMQHICLNSEPENLTLLLSLVISKLLKHPIRWKFIHPWIFISQNRTVQITQISWKVPKGGCQQTLRSISQYQSPFQLYAETKLWPNCHHYIYPRTQTVKNSWSLSIHCHSHFDSLRVSSSLASKQTNKPRKGSPFLKWLLLLFLLQLQHRWIRPAKTASPRPLSSGHAGGLEPAAWLCSAVVARMLSLFLLRVFLHLSFLCMYFSWCL